MEWNQDPEDDSEEYEINPGGFYVKWDDKKKKNDFCDRECYEFNKKFSEDLDDRCCDHCLHYLTLQCPHIKEFMDDIDDLDPG